ncbi:MAG TPA: hypothetical protein PLH94_10195 [Fimbriimonadaceae bacterium]|nr:hypothetical protein [Fimbriimonadaceae bacterium]
MAKVPKVLVFVGLGLMVLCGGGIAGVYVLFTRFTAQLPEVETFDVPGNADRYDPIAAVAALADLAGEGAYLVEARFTQVRSDGTMDLDVSYTPVPTARYTFVRKLAAPPENAPPIGAGRGIGEWFEEVDVDCSQPGTRRTQTTRGGSVNTRINYIHKGVAIRREAKSGEMPQELRALRPSPAEMWRRALEAGAPKEAVASITYEEDGARFSIVGTRYRFDWRPDGRLKD